MKYSKEQLFKETQAEMDNFVYMFSYITTARQKGCGGGGGGGEAGIGKEKSSASGNHLSFPVLSWKGIKLLKRLSF